MESFRLFIAIATITFIGWNIFYPISFKIKELRFIERLFISYGFGLAFISLQMLLFYFLNIKFDIGRIILPWSPLIALNLILYFKNNTLAIDRPTEIKDRGHIGLRIFLIFGIMFEILYAIFRALIKPIESYDAVAIYAIKSKIFYLAKSIPQDFFYNIAPLFPHPDYPLNIPLSETLIYLFLGNLNDQLVKIIFPLYFVGILGILYFSIRRFASHTYSLLFTFLLASIPQFNAYATNAYLDLPLSYYCFISALFLLKWFENIDQMGCLLISAVFVALSGWTKNEGLMYCAINIFLIAVFFILERDKIAGKEFKYLLIYLSVISAISLPWIWVKSSAHLVNAEIGPVNIDSLNLFKQSYEIKPIIYEFQKQFFGPKKWNILWPAVFFILIFNYKKAVSGIQKYMGISLLLIVSGYIFFYMFFLADILYFLSKTWSRFLIHFLPIVIFWMAHMLKEDINI